MALNKPQEEFIQDCLETYVDEFVEEPCNKNEFIQQIERLKHALSDAGEETVKDFMLYNCLRHPNSYFLKLEERVLSSNEKPITISDVQEFILRNLISPGIIKKAKMLNVNLKHIWNCENIITRLIGDKSKKTLFKSEKSRPADDINPHAFAPQDKIFSVAVYWVHKDEYPEVHATITTTLSLEIPSYQNNIKIKTYTGFAFTSIDEEDEYLRKQVPAAIKKAESIAIDYVLQYHGVNPTFYKNLKPQEKDNLLDRLIISLINHRILSIESAIHLTNPQKKLLSSTYYYEALKNRSLQIEDLLGRKFDLSTTISHILIQPTIINFIKKRIISLNEAKHLPDYFLTLLSEEFYYDLIKKNKTSIDWKNIYKTKGAVLEQLLNPAIIQAIAEYNWNFTDAINVLNFLTNKLGKQVDIQYYHLTDMTKQQIKNLFDPCVFDLLENEHLNIKKAINLNSEQKKLLSIYHVLLKQKYFTIGDLIEPLSPMEYIILSNTRIIDLIGKQKIRLMEAKIVPSYFLCLISEEFYYDLINKNQDAINWKDIFKTEKSVLEQLLNPAIIQAIAEYKWNFTQAIVILNFLTNKIHKQADIYHLTDMPHQKIKILFDPWILDLIEDNHLNIKKAINLNECQKELLLIYYQLLKQGCCKIDDLLGPNLIPHPKEYDTLSNPLLSDLIKKHKMTLQQAKKLTPEMVHLLSNKFYHNLFLQNSDAVISGETILTINKNICNLLLDIEIIQALEKSNYDFIQILNLIKNYTASYGFKLAKILIVGKISIAEINKMPYSLIWAINHHSTFSQWLDSGIITIKDILNKRPSEALIEAHAIYFFYLFKHSSSDNRFSIIHDSLRTSASLLNLPINDFNELTLKVFLSKIKRDIEYELENSCEHQTIYSEFINIISKAESEEKHPRKTNESIWQQALNKLIMASNAASLKIECQRTPVSYRMFDHTKKPDPISLRKFSVSINNFKFLCEVNQTTESALHRSSCQRR